MSKLYPCKPTITRNEYLQLVGLLTVAKRHTAMLREIIPAVREIIGEQDDRGHSEDAVWGDYSPEELLEKMEITVEPTPPNGPCSGEKA
jgi:hypothetical protein